MTAVGRDGDMETAKVDNTFKKLGWKGGICSGPHSIPGTGMKSWEELTFHSPHINPGLVVCKMPIMRK